LTTIGIGLLHVKNQKGFEGLVDKLFDFYVEHITSPQNVLKLRPRGTELPFATVEAGWRKKGTAEISAVRE
jgi:hypothetical protein